MYAAWFQAHPRWHVHWTPPHASWLNMIENGVALASWRKCWAECVVQAGGPDLSSQCMMPATLEAVLLIRSNLAATAGSASAFSTA